MEPPARPSLRARLAALRDELRQRLADADIIEPAWLAMLADCEIVIPALDREVPAAAPENWTQQAPDAIEAAP